MFLVLKLSTRLRQSEDRWQKSQRSGAHDLWGPSILATKFLDPKTEKINDVIAATG
jgi:hypothetical protein